MRSKWVFAALLVVVVVGALGSCQPGTSAPESGWFEAPMFEDADFDSAVVSLPRTRLLVAGAELEELTQWRPLGADALEEEGTGPRSRATLDGAVGVVAFVRNNPALSNNPWTVFLMDQVADATTLVYGGRREIDSVAVDADGDVLLLAMRRTFDTSGDFEVYRVTLSTGVVERLTVTEHDERNVSMSSDASVLVWEGEDEAGRRAVFVREADTEEHLALVLEQYQPSVSADGNTIALIRTLASGNPRVVRYEREANAYQVLWGQTSPVTLSQPSPSADGAAIAFLEYRPLGTAPSERQLVRYLDTDGGTVTNAVGVQLTDGPRIAHPHLAADGNHLTYAWRQDDAWNIFTRRMSTRDTQRIAVSLAPTTNHAPYWAQAYAAAGVLSVSIDQGDQALPVGGSIALSATVEVQGDASQDVNWTSGDDAIASVDATGLLTAVGEGITTVTATSIEDATKSGSITVTVVAGVEPLDASVLPTQSSCDGVAPGATCDVSVELVGNTGLVAAIEFVVTSDAFAVLSVSPGAITSGCFVDAVPSTGRVGMACVSDVVGDGVVAVIAVERTSSNASSFVTSDAVLTDAAFNEFSAGGGSLPVD